MKQSMFVVFFSLLVFCSISIARADTFGSGANAFDIEFVPIGDPGNLQDDFPNPAGAVGYRYRMGKYEISEQMIDKANAVGLLGITKDTRGPNKPATSITWFEAARFVNWLNESKGHTPAYKFDSAGAFQLWQPVDAGYDAANLYRNSLSKYFLPSIHEWHKAAYFDPVAGVYYDYSTGSDSIPDGIDFVGDLEFDAVFFDGESNSGPNDIMNVGLLSPFGTVGQGGNVYEWDENAFDRVNNIATEQRNVFGGSWVSPSNVLAAFHTSSGIPPTFEVGPLGFRVASIPEPTSLLLSFVLVAVLWLLRRPGFRWGFSA